MDFELPAPASWSRVGNLRAGGEGRHYDRLTALSARLVEAKQDLAAEFRAALLHSPQMTVRTPAAAQKRAPVLEVMADAFGGTDGDAALSELLQLVAAAAKGEDVQLRAIAWADAQAKAFGAWHASDLVANEEG